MFDVAVVGSANLDLVASAPRFPKAGETLLGTGFAEHPGGKGLNQAIAAARCDVRVAMVGAVGDDDAGRFLLATAQSAGVSIDDVAVVADRPTGRALITVDGNGENTIIVIPGANDSVHVASLAKSQVVIAQLEIPVAAVIDAFRFGRAAGARTVLNPAPADELPEELLELTDILVPNEHELALLGGTGELLRRGVQTIVTTRGAAGVTVTDAGATEWAQRPFAVTPVDTTGAGDAFCGALASRLSVGDDLRSAVRYAAAAGALATTAPGAVPSLPHAADVARLLAG